MVRPHKISRDNASRMVEINGLAITAGSSFNFFAMIGKELPTTFATTIIINIDKQTTPAIATPKST